VVDVAFVTTNPGKFREARTILRPFGVRLRWVRRELNEPQSDDLGTVARSKALGVRGLRGAVLVEDSGLFIPSLAGFPGVYSAHFLRIWGFRPILQLLRSRPRPAFYRSVAAVRMRGRCRTFVGEVHGRIASRPVGENGFGYDPIFIPDGYRETFGQLPSEVKDTISHRARSMAKVGKFLTTPPDGRSP